MLVTDSAHERSIKGLLRLLVPSFILPMSFGLNGHVSNERLRLQTQSGPRYRARGSLSSLLGISSLPNQSTALVHSGTEGQFLPQ